MQIDPQLEMLYKLKALKQNKNVTTEFANGMSL